MKSGIFKFEMLKPLQTKVLKQTDVKANSFESVKQKRKQLNPNKKIANKVEQATTRHKPHG